MVRVMAAPKRRRSDVSWGRWFIRLSVRGFVLFGVFVGLVFAGVVSPLVESLAPSTFAQGANLPIGPGVGRLLLENDLAHPLASGVRLQTMAAEDEAPSVVPVPNAPVPTDTSDVEVKKACDSAGSDEADFERFWQCKTWELARATLLTLNEFIESGNTFHPERAGFLLAWSVTSTIALIGSLFVFAFSVTRVSVAEGGDFLRHVARYAGDFVAIAALTQLVPAFSYYLETFAVQPAVRAFVSAQADAFARWVLALGDALTGTNVFGFLGSIVFSLLAAFFSLGIFFLVDVRGILLTVVIIFGILAVMGTPADSRWEGSKGVFKVAVALFLYPLIVAVLVWVAWLLGLTDSESLTLDSIFLSIGVLALTLFAFPLVMQLFVSWGGSLAHASREGSVNRGLTRRARLIGRSLSRRRANRKLSGRSDESRRSAPKDEGVEAKRDAARPGPGAPDQRGSGPGRRVAGGRRRQTREERAREGRTERPARSSGRGSGGSLSGARLANSRGRRGSGERGGDSGVRPVGAGRQAQGGGSRVQSADSSSAKGEGEGA